MEILFTIWKTFTTNMNCVRHSTIDGKNEATDVLTVVCIAVNVQGW